MKKQRALKIAAVCMAATLAGTTAFAGGFPVRAEEAKDESVQSVEEELTDAIISQNSENEVGKDETVYILANADGSTSKIIVSDWLKNGGASDVLKDASDLSDIENVKGSETYSDSGDSILWQADGADIYYQGTSNKQLPVDVKISYQLDGSEIAPEALAGKSGKVTIRFDYTNNEKRTVKIDGKDTEIYVPFMMVSGMILDNDKFTNVQVTNGKVISEGNHSIVMGVAMPGLGESLNLPDKLDVEIPEYVEVTADVEDFSLEMTISAAMTDMLSDVEGDSDQLNDLDDLDELNDSLDALTDASKQLVDGTSDVSDGAKELDGGANKLGNGTLKLADGTNTLQKAFEGDNGAVSGAKSLAAGAKQVSDGAKTLDSSVKTVSDGAKSVSDGAGSVSTGADTLSKGAASLKKGVSEVLSGATTLSGGLGQLSTGAKELSEGAKNLDAGVDELIASVKKLSKELGDSYAAAVNAEQQARAACEAAGIDPETNAGYAAANATRKTLEQIIGQMDPDLSKKLDSLAAGSEQLKSGIASASSNIDILYEGSKTLKTGVETVSGGTDTLVSGATELATGASALAKGASTLSEGTKELKEGTATLSTGAKSVSTGANALFQGVNQIYKGVKTVNSNMDSLKLGVKELMGGTGKLYLGTVDLKEGMAEFDREGVKTLTSKLKAALDDYDILSLKKRVQETVDAGREYTIFTDAAKGTVSSVKFIYKTEGIGE